MKQIQLQHSDHIPAKARFPIILICDQISNTANIGGMLRLADAFSISKLVFHDSQNLFSRKVKKASRTTENFVDLELVPSLSVYLKYLREINYRICALEITQQSIPLTQFKLDKEKPLALVVGNEVEGISEDLLNLVDFSVHIQMFGHNSSMNVVAATSILLYEATRQYKIPS